MASFVYELDWDPAKANANRSKHGVGFEQAAEIFRDPLALTIPDDEHSETEVRWITMGRELSGRYIVVIHTYRQLTELVAHIRLISARWPTRAEVRAYEDER
jgi:hypothetical protein